MPFEPGQSGNPEGRPKGARNKVNELLRETISDFLNDQFEKITEDFKKLNPKDRVRLYVDLLQYAVPKLQSVELPTPFDRLPDDQIDQIIDSLKNPYHEENNQAGENTTA